MKINLFSIFLAYYLLFQIHSKMTDKEREILLNKLTKKIPFDNEEEIPSLKEKYLSRTLKETINYRVKDIDQIIEKYGFPKNYNFFEDTGATIRIKDQQRCGCCWSHAATTSLAYRFQKIGNNIDLSPQDALSCYLRDCDAGNYLIDAAMNLVKNGTVTEGCLPFSSGDGITIEQCPSRCKDGSTYRKYYGQNAYMTQDYYSQETFLEIVPLIMDQLITNGPVVTSISVYEDFMDLHYDTEKCKNEVYTYDGKSEYLGGHAVSLVGYGFMNSKYYWLLQNSWGKDVCDNGFVKVEFGNIGVEEVAFIEPYKSKGRIPVTIPVKLNSFDGECTMNVSSTRSDYWENTLDIGFLNSQTNKLFPFQCSMVSLVDGKKTSCYFEYYNFFTYKGKYEYFYHMPLGGENDFTLDSSFIKEFNFLGIDQYDYIYSNFLFVSQEGSKILLLYTNNGGDDRFISPIYPNKNSTTSLSSCEYINLGGIELVNCNIKQNEVDYFDSVNELSYTPLVNTILCGYKEEIPVIVYKLDKTKYPVFKIKSLILPDGDTLSSKSVITGVADIEGSLSGYHAPKSIFTSFIDIEMYGQNVTALLECELKPRRVMRNYLFDCKVGINEGFELPYTNLYLYPYNIPDPVEYPYEVYIPNTLKAQKYDPTLFIPKIQVYIESLCPDCINFITKSFKDFYDEVKKPNLVDIEFIPFGNAHEVYNTSTQKYDFTCQHGDNECYGNLVETCAINILGRVKSYGTILCIETNIARFQKNFDDTLEYCLSNDQENLKEIKECISSDLGNFYEHQMAQKTDPGHLWVPWVVVDGYHDENIENEIIESLINYVCGDDKTKCY